MQNPAILFQYDLSNETGIAIPYFFSMSGIDLSSDLCHDELDVLRRAWSTL